MFKKTLFALALVAGLAMAFAEPYVWDTAGTLAEPEAAAPGGSATLAVLSGARTWNPIMSREVDDARDLTLAYVSLVTRDTVTRQWKPWAAESIDVSADGLTITATLRPELQWSDGEPMTASDFLLTYTLTQDPEVESPNADLFFVGDQVVEISAPDESTLVFEFPSVTRRAFSIVGFLYPTPDHVLGEIYRSGGAEAFKGAWGTDTPLDELVFDGPFMLEEYSPDERYRLVRNPAFGAWNVDSNGTPLPYLDSINYTIAEQDAQLNLFLAAELDVYAPGNLDDVAVVAQAVNNGEVDAVLRPNLYAPTSTTFYGFNWNLASDPFKQELFRNVNFRRAMSHLTPRDSIVDLVYGGAAAPAYVGVGSPFVQWFPPEDQQVRYEFDPERALELLANIGFTETNEDGWLVDADGNVLEFNLTTNAGNQNREQEIQIIADTMREYGVKVETAALDFGLLVDQLLSTGDDRPFEAILIGLTAGSEDWPFSESVYTCTGSLHLWNQSGACIVPTETLISELALAGNQTLDDAEAQEIAFQLQAEYARLQGLVYTSARLLHAAWASDIGGEYADDVISALAGTRSLVTTFAK